MLRVAAVHVLGGHRVLLDLTDGTRLERDIEPLLQGDVFAEIRSSEDAFAAVRVEGGTLVWPGGADLCPDMLIWGGMPAASGARPPQQLELPRRVAA